MKKLSKILIPFMMVGLLAPSLVYGQMQQQTQNRFEQEFRNTNEVINRVRNIISSSGIDKGSELLKLAEAIQGQARTLGMNRNFVTGITMTYSAREKAKNAGMLNQQANENENLVRRQLEKTEKLLDRIRANMPIDAGQRIESLYNTARENQRRAREFYHNQQLKPAFKLSRQVENSLKRVIERVKEMKGNLEQLQNQVNRLENKITRLENMVQECGNERATKIFNKAKNHFENIVRKQNDSGIEGLESQFRLMNQQLNSVIEICQGTNFQTEQLNRLQLEMERVSNLINENGNKKAQKLLKTAEKNLRKAERLCLNGETDACAANLKAAQINLRKAKRLAGL